MNHFKSIFAVASLCLTVTLRAETPGQLKAKKLVLAAVEYAKRNGMEKLIKQTNQQGGIFHVGDKSEMYLFLYDQQGYVKAIGYNPGPLVGQCRIDLKDPDGKMILREFIKLAQSQGSGWVDYKYPNPTNGLAEKKSSFIYLHDKLIFGCGTYLK